MKGAPQVIDQSALFAHAAPVVAIPLAFLFGQQMVPGLAPKLIKVLPWVLTIPPNNSDTPSIAMPGIGP